MTAEQKANWIAALRSGKYKQGKRALRQPIDGGGDSYCCLGVLCDITPGVTWACNWKLWEASYCGETHSAVLPETLAEKLGIDKRGELGLCEGLCELTDENDAGATFAEIADLIEKHLPVTEAAS